MSRKKGKMRKKKILKNIYPFSKTNKTAQKEENHNY